MITETNTETQLFPSKKRAIRDRGEVIKGQEYLYCMSHRGVARHIRILKEPWLENGSWVFSYEDLDINHIIEGFLSDCGVEPYYIILMKEGEGFIVSDKGEEREMRSLDGYHRIEDNLYHSSNFLVLCSEGENYGDIMDQLDKVQQASRGDE